MLLHPTKTPSERKILTRKSVKEIYKKHRGVLRRIFLHYADTDVATNFLALQ